MAAKEWQVQRILVKRLKDIALRTKITHAEIAKRAGTSRTRVTAILNDDLEHVSTDLLIRILGSLGYRVRVSVVKSDAAALTHIVGQAEGKPTIVPYRGKAALLESPMIWTERQKTSLR